MAKKPETVFKERVARDLKKIPGIWFEKIQQVAIRGTPDYLICLAGKFIALELKASEKDLPDPLQRHKLMEILRAGGVALVAWPGNWKATYEGIRKLA